MKKFLTFILLLIPLFIYAYNFQVAYDEFPASTGQTHNIINVENGHILGNAIGIFSGDTYKIKSGLIYFYNSTSVSIDETSTYEYSDILYENSPTPLIQKQQSNSPFQIKVM